MRHSEEQKNIYGHECGHAIIDADAGSGKTTTTSLLISNLLDKGFDASKILVLMFGSEAKKDFEFKLLSTVTNPEAPIPKVKTFNSLGQILCNSFEKKGIIPKCRLEVNSKTMELMALSAIKSVVSDRVYNEIVKANSKFVETFVSFIDFVKSGLLPPSEVYCNLGLSNQYSIIFSDAFYAFEEARNRKRIRFFSDQVYDSVRAIIANPKLREWIGNKKEYIIIDEFQDTNTIQYELIKIIAGTTANVIIVGDIKQSIFEWRGSDIEIMRTLFSKDFPNPTKYTLSQTFRFGPELAMISSAIIHKNIEGKSAQCVSNPNNPNTTFHINQSSKPGKEALKIIKDEIANGFNLGDIVIVCRLYSASVPLELELLSNNIPCGVDGSFGLVDSYEFKGIESIVELAAGKFKKMSEKERFDRFVSLFKFPHIGLKNSEVEYIASELSGYSSKYSMAARKIRIVGIKPYLIEKINKRADLISFIENSSDNDVFSKVIKAYIASSDMKKNVEKMAMSEVEASEKLLRMEFIVNFISENDGKPLDVINKLRTLKDFSNSNIKEKVLITSIHKAKGLEFPIVLIPGLENEKFPYVSNDKNKTPANEEAERRLFYVAATRAINKCYVIAPNDRDLEDYKKCLDPPYHLTNMASSKFLFETNIMSCKEDAKNLLLNINSNSERLRAYKERLKIINEPELISEI